MLDRFFIEICLMLRLWLLISLWESKMEMRASKISDFILIDNLAICSFMRKILFVLTCIVVGSCP